jgi:hypothetical protein
MPKVLNERKESNIMNNKKKLMSQGDRGSPASYGHGSKYVPDSMPATGYNKFMFKNVIPKVERAIDFAKDFKRKNFK